MLKSRITGTIGLGVLAGVALGAGGTGNEYTLFEGEGVIQAGDAYDKIFMGGTADVRMTGGAIAVEASVANGGTLRLEGGEIGHAVYVLDQNEIGEDASLILSGTRLGTAIHSPQTAALLAAGGLGEITVEAARFYHDADGDGEADEPLLVSSGDEMVIEAGHPMLEPGSSGGSIVRDLRWVYPDGTEQASHFVANESGGQAWVGSLTLRVTGNPSDLDGDGVVGSGDLGMMLAAWGGADALMDLDGSGEVSSGDLGILLAAWGE